MAELPNGNRRNLKESRIPEDSLIILELTKITSPPSLRPADGSI